MMKGLLQISFSMTICFVNFKAFGTDYIIVKLERIPYINSKMIIFLNLTNSGPNGLGLECGSKNLFLS